MKTLRDYLEEAETEQHHPRTGDVFAFELEDGTLLETYVMDQDDRGDILLDSTNNIYSLLEEWGLLGASDAVMESLTLKEFAPGNGGDSGNYLKALASAWYNHDIEMLQDIVKQGGSPMSRIIDAQVAVEKILGRGIVCGDGKVRKYHIDYNSDFDGVEIYSDDYYEHGDYDATIDSRTGQPWGPYEHVEFKDDDLDESIDEAKYQGREVPLGKKMKGDVKKFKVYVRNPKTGNIKKVNFGHGGTSAKRAGQKTMSIKRSNPARRKSFRARHNCDNPGPRTGARYWSCRNW
jgi:hypothetical protein